MDRLEAMSILLEAVEVGSLSAAGRKRRIPLATVSRKVSDLEAHVGARLVNRSNRQLTLTDAGQSYAVACKRILEDVEAAERAASGEYIEPRGDLVMTTPIVFGRLHVLPVAAAFLDTYPDINIRMVLADRVADLADEHIDVAIRIGALPDSSLVAVRVGSIRRVVCASPAYLAKRGVPQKPSDLAAHACVTFAGLMSQDSWEFGAGSSREAVAVRSRLTVNTAEAAIDAAIASAGLTRVLSYQVAEALEAGKLIRVLAEHEPAPAPVSLVYRAGGAAPLKQRAFLDFATPRLRARLAHLS